MHPAQCSLCWWQVASGKRRQVEIENRWQGWLNGAACSHEGGQTDRVKILEVSARFVCPKHFSPISISIPIRRCVLWTRVQRRCISKHRSRNAFLTFYLPRRRRRRDRVEIGSGSETSLRIGLSLSDVARALVRGKNMKTNSENLRQQRSSPVLSLSLSLSLELRIC